MDMDEVAKGNHGSEITPITNLAVKKDLKWVKWLGRH
jgi:hypothetical protein